MSTRLQSQTSSIPIGLIRSTGIGGLLAAGIGVLLYYCFPTYVALVDRHWFAIICTAIGTGLYQALKHTLRLVLKAFLKPDSFDYKLQKLDRLHEDKRISDDNYMHMIKKLCEKEFLE